MEMRTDGTCSILNDDCPEINITDCRECQLHSVVDDYRNRVYRMQEEEANEKSTGKDWMKMGSPYYIYDNYNEEFYSTSFAEFEDAEREMEYLKKKREADGLTADFDIYEKIT